MYECAIRISTGRTALAGMMVFAVALVDCVSVGPALAQTLGGPPAVVVDESVLDQLGPPPQSLPDVILQQQPQAYRPAPRDKAGSAKDGATVETGRLLPPPSVMPRSRAMLPSNLKSPTAQPATRSRPQTARVPKKAPAPKPKPPETPAAAVRPVTRSMPVPKKTEPPKASVVPSEITPPPVSVPPAPKITPPTREPAAEAETPTPAEPARQAAVPEPSPPPVAEPEMPKAPPAPAPKVAAPEPAAVETPKRDEPKAAEAPMPSGPGPAAVPPAPKIVPPTPPAAAKAPAETPKVAEKAKVAEKPATPRLVRPAPPAPPAASKPGNGNKSTASGGDAPASRGGTQVAALPGAPPAEILDGGQIYRIPFGPSSSEISEDGKKYLDELAQRMKDESSLRLQLLGYAGSTQDSASKARRTSLFRALSVRTYLMKQGVRSTRMDVRALGNRVEDGSPDRVDAVVRK